MSEQATHSPKLFSRDVNYLRDVALFWPFVLYSVFAVSFSPTNRTLALRCAVVAIAALSLAKEKLLLFLVAIGFIAIRAPFPWPCADGVGGFL